MKIQTQALMDLRFLWSISHITFLLGLLVPIILIHITSPLGFGDNPAREPVEPFWAHTVSPMHRVTHNHSLCWCMHVCAAPDPSLVGVSVFPTAPDQPYVWAYALGPAFL
ncbi:hypothetical protein ACFX15_033418 [Malus domestica]